jgi:hypothetical protein
LGNESSEWGHDEGDGVADPRAALAAARCVLGSPRRARRRGAPSPRGLTASLQVIGTLVSADSAPTTVSSSEMPGSPCTQFNPFRYDPRGARPRSWWTTSSREPGLAVVFPVAALRRTCVPAASLSDETGCAKLAGWKPRAGLATFHSLSPSRRYALAPFEPLVNPTCAAGNRFLSLGKLLVLCYGSIGTHSWVARRSDAWAWPNARSRTTHRSARADSRLPFQEHRLSW